MAHIRCLSNPENLYVYSNFNDEIVWHNKATIPAKEFKRFLYKFGLEEGRAGDIEIKEIKIPRRLKVPIKLKIGGEIWKPCNYKYCLYYKGELVAKMWYVTWAYIAQNMMKDFNIK